MLLCFPRHHYRTSSVNSIAQPGVTKGGDVCTRAPRIILAGKFDSFVAALALGHFSI